MLKSITLPTLLGLEHISVFGTVIGKDEVQGFDSLQQLHKTRTAHELAGCFFFNLIKIYFTCNFD